MSNEQLAMFARLLTGFAAGRAGVKPLGVAVVMALVPVAAAMASSLVPDQFPALRRRTDVPRAAIEAAIGAAAGYRTRQA